MSESDGIAVEGKKNDVTEVEVLVLMLLQCIELMLLQLKVKN